MERIEKEHLGLAAEFAVASGLCRRNFYAQLTLGNRKRTDLTYCSAGGSIRSNRSEGKARTKLVALA